VARSALRPILAAAVLTIAAAQPALTQEPAGAPAPVRPEPADLEQMFMEFQRIHLELEEIQNRALQDSTLQATQEGLGSDIQKAMETADPTLPEWMARVSVLEAEAHAAQQADDVPRLEVVVAERDSLTQRFFALQNQIVGEPEMAGRIAGFQADLQRKMVEIAPHATRLIERLRQLESVLQEAMDT
jgi:hypothetical protein